MTFCSNCGLKLKVGMNFCPKCGKQVVVYSTVTRKTTSRKKTTTTKANNFNYAIIENFGVISQGLEFKLIYINKTLYDLRHWRQDGSMGIGVRFDIEFIKKILHAYYTTNGFAGYLRTGENYTLYKTSKIYCTIVSLPLDLQGWNIELNVIEWNDPGRLPIIVFDIREWSNNHVAPKKHHGIRLSEAEMRTLIGCFEKAVTKVDPNYMKQFRR